MASVVAVQSLLKPALNGTPSHLRTLVNVNEVNINASATVSRMLVRQTDSSISGAPNGATISEESSCKGQYLGLPSALHEDNS